MVLESGVELSDEQLAVACSSHAGEPAHLALAQSMLSEAGLDPSQLRCPPGPALDERSRRRLADEAPNPLHHCCSGKHAAMLAASVARGWPLDSYLDPDHPGQLEIRSLVEQVTREPATPVGVDGCGYPTLRGTVRGMARAYSALMFDSRFERAKTAMQRFPALVGGSHLDESQIAVATGGVGKTGAAGLLAIGVPGRFGLAVKSADGSTAAAATGAGEICLRLGVVPVADRLAAIASRPITGGGETVGSWVGLP